MPITTANRHDLSDALVVQVETARVALLIAGRNAWHSTWVSRYRTTSAMFGDVKAAKRAAEPLRKQGTQFSVREVPALVLRSWASTLVLLDFHTENCFASYRPYGTASTDFWRGLYQSPTPDPWRAGMSLKQAVDNFRDRSAYWEHYPQPSHHSLLVGAVSEPRELNRSSHQKKLAGFRSSPQGVGWPLAWSAMSVRYSWRGTYALAKQLSASLSQIEGYDAALEHALLAEAAEPYKRDHDARVRTYTARRRLMMLLHEATAAPDSGVNPRGRQARAPAAAVPEQRGHLDGGDAGAPSDEESIALNELDR